MDTNLYEKRERVQNQQINTFTKGMNTDTSDMYLSSELYRYAENVRPVTNKDSNSGELHLIEGTVLSDDTNYEILATNYIRDIAVYIVKGPDSSNVVDEDLETEYTEYTHGSWYVFKKVGNESLKRVFGPCTELLWETEDKELDIEDIKKSITTVLRYEAPLNIKLYIADSTGKHSIMVLNIAKTYGNGTDESKFDDVFAYQRTLLPPAEVEIGSGSGSIISGKVQYVYRLYSKNGASTPLSVLSKTLNLYKNEYSGYEAEKRSGRSVNISVNILDRGNLDYIQIYRISYLLSGELPKISLVKDEKIVSSFIDTGVNIQEDVGISEFLSMFTPFVYPKQIESKGDYLFAANMKYSLDDVDALFENFDAKSYSVGSKYDGRRIILGPEVGTGFYVIPEHLPEDTEQYKVLDKLQHDQFTTENINVYNDLYWREIKDGFVENTISVNAGESYNIDIDLINELIENNRLMCLYSMSHVVNLSLDIYYTYEDSGQNNTYLISLAIPNGYNIISELLRRIDYINSMYQFILFNTISVSSNASSNFQFVIVYEGEDYIYCNGYGKNICWRYTYDELPELSVHNQTGKSNKQNDKSTFRCGETYRFGVKLYNLYGQASSVKWIADIMIPDHANIYNDDGITKFRNVGIEFIKTPGSNWDGITGWEIVRCERTLNDRKAITQGIIGHPLECYDRSGYDENLESTKSNILNMCQDEKSTNLICNPGFFSTDFCSYLAGNTASISSKNILMFSSPEYCYLKDDIENILKLNNSDLQIKLIYKCYPNSDSEDYETQLSQNPGKRIFSKQTQNERMSLGFYWPSDHYSFTRIKDWHFIVNYTNLYALQRGFQKQYGDGSKTRFYFNYFTPDYTTINNLSTVINIDNVSVVDSPKYSDFANNEILTYKNNIVSILNKQFVNWSWPLALIANGQDETTIKNIMDNINPSSTMAIGSYFEKAASSPIGAGGRLILFHINENLDTDGNEYYVPSITISNVIKHTIPYNGYNKSSIDNSSYVSFGDYSTENSISVFSGDTKNRIFTYNALHIWYDPTYKNCVKMSSVYAIPVETDIDIQALYGLLYGVDNFNDYNIQDTAAAFDNYTLDKDSYLYNPAYNATPDIVNWTSSENLDSKIDYFDTRIHYSKPKINNEDVDNWIQFLASNYLDVDTRFGEITDLKLFKDKLIFWLENATGLLAVNERVVLNDQNDTQVVLGTGGVLERYDYFTTVYGLKKNQHARATSNDSLYWWDENNREILLYSQKYDVTPLSTVKNIKNYINDNPVSSIPFLTYDNKYKEIIANVVNKGSIVYNEQIQAFSSVYTFSPIFEAIVDSNLYLTDKKTIYKYNEHSDNISRLFTENATPTIKYVVNEQSMYNKTFDILTFGGRLYGGGFDDDRSIPYTGTETLSIGDRHARNNDSLKHLTFTYKTPLKQEARVNGKDVITNTEYDFRLTIPRAGYETVTIENEGLQNESRTYEWNVKEYGDRMRGKTMQCELKSDSNDLDFSLQYITTKFRMSWT